MRPPTRPLPATLLLSPTAGEPGLPGTDSGIGPPAPIPHAPPLYQTVAYEAANLAELDQAVQGQRYFYLRHGSPNESAAAQLLARLEAHGLPDAEAGQIEAVLFASGMAAVEAAITAAVEALPPPRPQDGPHGPPLVVVASPLYTASQSLLRALACRGQLTLHEAELATPDELAEHLRSLGGRRVAAIYCEVLSNPRLRVSDLDALAKLAGQCGAALIADATFVTPLLCRPLCHGAALVVHSATKFLGGHGDVCAGVVTGRAALMQRVRAHRQLHGAVLDPFAAWLLQRSLRTLSVRLMRQVENAQALASFLTQHADRLGLAEVIYPGLPSHPDHLLASRLLDRPGAMLSLVTVDEQRARRLYESVRVLRRVTSLGDVETLLMYPAATWGHWMSPDEQQRLGITPGLLRISVGIEDLADLQADLWAALS